MCVSIRKKSIKQNFSNITGKRIVTNREFWKTRKPFLAKKGCLDNSEIKYLTKLINEHYINIVELSCCLKPEKIVFHYEDSEAATGGVL